MDKRLIASLVILGMTSVISQVVVIRELVASFYGNEFFIGWILFSWFMWVALGTFWGNRHPSKTSELDITLAGSYVVAALAVSLGIIFIRANHLVLGHAAGALPDLFPSFLYTFVVTGPLCFFLGFQFTVISRITLTEVSSAMGGSFLGKAYFYETIGFIVGGTVFSLFFVKWNVFRVMGILIGLDFFAAGIWIRVKARMLAGITILMGFMAALLFFFNADAIETFTAQMRFPSEKLLLSRNTLHGNIAVTGIGKQRHFYQNGSLIGADRETMTSEYLVHFSMLAHPEPKKLLLLGTAFNGLLREGLKYHHVTIDSVDIDPGLLQIAAGYVPRDLREGLVSSRVRFEYQDPRDFFQSHKRKYDVIIANFPDPVSVLVNRNYTREFFQEVHRHLEPHGLFALRMSFAANYVSPEMERIGSSIYATLRHVFPSVIILPEDTIYFIASPQKSWTPDLGNMTERLVRGDIKTDFVTPELLQERFTNDRVLKVQKIFEQSIWQAHNTDLRPRVCYDFFLRWLSQFHPRLARWFGDLSQIPFAVAAVMLLIFFFFPMWQGSGASWKAKQLAWISMFAAGFSVMAFEIVLIYLFQVFWGDLYYRIAVLITVLMTGVGIGTFFASTAQMRSPQSRLILVHFLAMVFYLGLGLSLFEHSTGSQIKFFEHGNLFYICACLTGFLAGFVFPIANHLYLDIGKGKQIGLIYGADLIGSCLGVLLTAGFLVSIWGVTQTLFLLACLNGLVILFYFFSSSAKT